MTKTPPGGVASQLAPKVYPRADSENWDGAETGQHDVGDDTPVGLETEDAAAETRLRYRVKETNVTTQQIARRVDDAHRKIDNLGNATTTSINGVRADVQQLDEKLNTHTLSTVQAIGDLKAEMKGSLGHFAGQVGELVKAVDDKRELRQQINMAHVDVAKFGKQTEIADKADEKKAKRERITKLVTGGVTLLTSGAVIGFLVTHLSC